MITPEVIAAHNLTPEEFRSIKDLLGREPNLVELGVFSVMWSEHCSYKSSRRHLRKFPTTGPKVICGPGENAGVIDNGDILVNAMCVGLADADKIFYSAAPAPGLSVVYFGSKTGRDGIHGATMAS